MLHSYYDEILGQEPVRERSLLLDELGITMQDFQHIDEPFTEDEVWKVIRELPSDKAPGPDGFTAAFYQTAWPIIEVDVMAAIHAFFRADRRQFQCLNGALITLLPKTPDARVPKDYRPLSLIHSFPKLGSKILANCLAPFLPTLISSNQNAFIKGRFILDNLKYVQRAARSLRARKIPLILLKLDILKVFNTVAWPFLLEVLRAWGFSNKWCGWIELLLSTASTRVLLNGNSGEVVRHHQGLRQGDPLSPMLFILAMDVLDRLFAKLEAWQLLQPIGHPAVKHRCNLYADNVILFTAPDTEEF